MFYSKTTSGFYDSKIHDGLIPSDAVSITPEYHKELLEGQSSGKMIQADNKGYPRLIERPAPSPEEMQAIRNAEARAYLAKTDWYVVRFAETGQAIPDDIRAARETARASVVE